MTSYFSLTIKRALCVIPLDIQVLPPFCSPSVNNSNTSL